MEAIPLSSQSDVSEEELSRARLYRLLSRLLGAPADDELLLFLRSLKGDDSPLGQGLAALSGVAGRLSVEEVAQEFNDLFIGVIQGELLPYGSHYLTGFLNEKPLADLRDAMSELGIARSDAASEPEDHIASLLEIMHGMILGDYGKPVSLADQFKFFKDHVETWSIKFFEDLEAAKSARLFMSVGLIGRLFMEIEGEAFKIAA